MRNLNLIFNKLYYENMGEIFKGKEGEKAFSSSVEKYNNIIFNTTFQHEKDYVKKMSDDVNSFILKTTYPGMLIGTGNPHGTGQCDEDINMGFSFDYVTGQPYIPGSSVKGMLRSYFKSAPEVIEEIIGEGKCDIKALEKEIFDDDKDVFFDAVLYDGNEYGLFMGEDYITPHKEATKNPVPIRIIKILPDVRFEFRFMLNDGLINCEEKLELFSMLIQTFGIGAKTNVGYGVFVNDDSNGKIPEKKELPQRNYQPRQQNNTQQSTRQPVNNQRNSSGEKVKCPKCGWFVFKYKKFSNELETTCFKCNAPLYPKK